MAEYIAREWSNGDIVTASNLNQIENGVEAVTEESEFLVVNMTETTESETGGKTEVQLKMADSTPTYTLDKTWQQIYDAFPKVYLCGQMEGITVKYIVETVFFRDGEYSIYNGEMQFVTDSPNGYPSSAFQK